MAYLFNILCIHFHLFLFFIRPEFAVFVEQVKCQSKKHLDGKLERILDLGGEGLMIRQPKSVYERTRSKTLLKIKKFYDAEVNSDFLPF